MKILILHASAGAGHRRAAEALERAFRLQAPGAEVRVCDMLDFTPPVFRKTYARGYLNIVRAVPELWGYMYSQADKKSLQPWRRRVRSVFNKLNTHSFFGFLRDWAPDAVVCTHFLPLETLSTRMRRMRAELPLFCVVTDFAVHALWIVERVRRYYVASEEAKRHLVRNGLPVERVCVTGIPIDPVFARREQPRRARQRLGLAPELPTVLLLTGGFGVGPAVELIRSFAGMAQPCQLLAVAGSNQQLQRDAGKAARGIRIPIRVFGFVDNIHELMDAADLVVSKPGGLTSAEVLAKGRPLLIIDPIPGQEQRNGEHLLEAGAAARLFDVQDAPFKIAGLLADKRRLARMRRNAAALGRPDAAAQIADDVVAKSEAGRPAG
ncbi:MAG: hypothetical protein JXR37_15700 [Kiritimatiellae bacterium]|nr:hypothetical protein [Kiritimatiellia bacterium]